MRLRAALASFLDIFRVCLRFGWIGSYDKVRDPVFRPRRGGENAVAGLRRRRRKLGLLLPRGPAADRLGLTWTGEIPTDWRPIAERRKAATDFKKKREKQARGSPTKRGSPKKRS